jgi:transcriptional regulator with XRE-family HTH domain
VINVSVFGENLSKAIKESGISKIKLAQLLNTTATTIYRWEKGIHEAPDDSKRSLPPSSTSQSLI